MAVKRFIENVAGNDTNIIHFKYGEYREDNYFKMLKTARWGVWVGEHESQGFAMQEALAMDVPLLVLNVASMRDENGCPGGPYCNIAANYTLAATSATSFDDNCGELVSTVQELQFRWMSFISNVEARKYTPRMLMQKAVSPMACAARLMQMYNRHRTTWCEQQLTRDARNRLHNYYNQTVKLCHKDCCL